MLEKKQTIVFNLSILYALDEMYPVIEKFSANGWKVILHFGVRYEIPDQTSHDLRQRGIDIIFAPLKLSYVKSKPTSGTAEGGATTSVHKKDMPLSLWNRLNDFVAGVLHGLSAKKYARNFLKKTRPDIVISNNFLSCCKLDNAIIAYCKSHKIKKYCLIVAAYASKKHSQPVRVNNLKMGMLPRNLEAGYDTINKVCAKLFPSWTYSQGDNSIFAFDPVLMLAAKVVRLLPDDPWQNPAIDFDCVFVTHKYSRTLLLESGYCEDKIKFVGHPRLDSALETISNPLFVSTMYEDLGLSENEPFILWNIEPGFEHNYITHKEHWDNFTKIYGILKETGLKVVLSLHPCCNPCDYQFVESDTMFKISKNYKIHTLYPFCKFAVSHPCSTDIYGSYFGKDIVVHDFYNLKTNSQGFEEKYCHQHTVVVDNFGQLRSQVGILAKKKGDSTHGHKFQSSANKILEYIRNS